MKKQKYPLKYPAHKQQIVSFLRSKAKPILLTLTEIQAQILMAAPYATLHNSLEIPKHRIHSDHVNYEWHSGLFIVWCLHLNLWKRHPLPEKMRPLPAVEERSTARHISKLTTACCGVRGTCLLIKQIKRNTLEKTNCLPLFTLEELLV